MITTLLLVGWRPKAYLYLCTLHLLTGWVYVCCRVHNNQEDDRMLVNANVSERTAVRHTLACTALSVRLGGSMRWLRPFISLLRYLMLVPGVCYLCLNCSGSCTTPRFGQQSRSVFTTVSLLPRKPSDSVTAHLHFSRTHVTASLSSDSCFHVGIGLRVGGRGLGHVQLQQGQRHLCLRERQGGHLNKNPYTHENTSDTKPQSRKSGMLKPLPHVGWWCSCVSVAEPACGPEAAHGLRGLGHERLDRHALHRQGRQRRARHGGDHIHSIHRQVFQKRWRAHN